METLRRGSDNTACTSAAWLFSAARNKKNTSTQQLDSLNPGRGLKKRIQIIPQA